MNRLAEILESGRAPGFAGLSQDPTSADMAVPRALRHLEQTKGADAMVREMGFKPTRRNVEAVRKTWKFAT